MVELVKLKYPVILVRDAQDMILEEMNLEDTQKHLNNTTFNSKEEQWAFRSGMNYAALLLTSKCYNFCEVRVDKKDVENYYEN